jgi:uncharacterized protein involved in exopolysaccharide biosynthesis
MLSPQQVHDVWHYVRRALVRHWLLAGAVAALMLVLTVVAVAVLPRVYASEARLFVRFGRENLMLDPTASTGQMISVYESRESEINSLLEVLKSRAMLDQLVESLGTDFVLGGSSEPKPATPVPAPGDNSQPSPAHQQAAQLLEKNIDVWAPRKSNIITVQCKAGTPARAQQIAARLVEIYLAEYVRVHRTAGSYQFFEDQTQLSKEEWQQASAKLNAAKDKLGIVTIDGKKKQLQDEISDIDNKLLANRSDLKTAEARIVSLLELIGGLPQTVITSESQAPNAAFDSMRAALFQLESREQELAATRSDGHPQLEAVRQQIADLRTVLREQPSQRTQTTQAVNPSRQALELNLLTERSQLDALRGREKSLVAQKSKLRDDLKQLNSQEQSLSQMLQEVDLAEARHKSYADKLEQARINRSLDEERISSLTVVQPASFPTRPSGPRRMAVIALGLVVSFASGLGSALVAAWFAPVLASAIDLERLWDVPLVAILPPLERRQTASR